MNGAPPSHWYWLSGVVCIFDAYEALCIRALKLSDLKLRLATLELPELPAAAHITIIPHNVSSKGSRTAIAAWLASTTLPERRNQGIPALSWYHGLR